MSKVTEHDMVAKLKELFHELGKTPTIGQFEEYFSKRQIHKHGYNNLVKKAGLEPNQSSHTSKPIEVIIRPPRVLIFDLEVSTKIVHTYQMRDAYIGPDQVINDCYILSYSAKFLDDDKIFYLDTRFSPKDDEHILEALHYLIEQADFICGHNMARFDLPTLKARMIKKGMKPLKDLQIIDTLKISRKHFKFTFHKLGELAKYLNCELKKDKHESFSGISLFTEAMNGNIEAFNAMEHYCKMDVLVTEQILKKLLPWDSSTNFQSNYQKAICTCGSEKFTKNGYRYAKNGVFQLYRCSECRKTFSSKENLINKDIKKTFLK